MHGGYCQTALGPPEVDRKIYTAGCVETGKGAGLPREMQDCKIGSGDLIQHRITYKCPCTAGTLNSDTDMTSAAHGAKQDGQHTPCSHLLCVSLNITGHPLDSALLCSPVRMQLLQPAVPVMQFLHLHAHRITRLNGIAKVPAECTSRTRLNFDCITRLKGGYSSTSKMRMDHTFDIAPEHFSLVAQHGKCSSCLLSKSPERILKALCFG